MPQKILDKSERAGGVLPVSAAARAASSRQSATRLKLEIRRLPPGLTLTEFEATLGPEWKLGGGRVDWREYRQGKIKSPGKPPEQSRCYLHVSNEAHIKELEQRFLAVLFHDKAGTHRNVELRHLPPTLGYAANQRVPTLGKTRLDNRQGTIDQDPEFIAFLEAETQPIVKSTAIDSTLREKDEPKVEIKSTPLIDDLREKKANKAKAAASKAEKKGHKRVESKDAPAQAIKENGKGKDKVDVKKVEQAAKDAVKALSKPINTKQTPAAQTTTATQTVSSPARRKREKPQSAPKIAASAGAGAGVDAGPAPATGTAAAPSNSSPISAPSSPAPQRPTPAQRPRRDAEGIKKMLQKDLGIKPKDGTVRSRGGTQTPAAQTAQSPSSQPLATARPKPKAASATPTPDTAQPKAFLKHANPSQGITEALIHQALAQHCEVTNVTIDSRKGTAIAVFKTQDDLQKAIQVRKMSVADGAVEVLEYKDRGAAGSSSRGGFKGSGRGSRGKASTPGAAATSTAQSSN